MNVKIKDWKRRKNGFTPYSVTFNIGSFEDSEEFHDRVAIIISNEPNGMIGDIFCRGRGEIKDPNSYDI